MQNELTQLLNQPPGSLVYHLVTLFALQIIWGLSMGIWRRNRQNRAAIRMNIAAGSIFLMRLALLLATLLLDDDQTAVFTLTALTQAADSITAVFIAWALVPHSRQLPRLGDTFMAIGLFAVLIMNIYFAQSGNNADTATISSNVWTLFVVFVYGTGLIFLLANSDKRTSLRTTILLTLLVATAIGWIRVGYLIAFPLWAALLYDENNHPAATFSNDVRENLTRTLQLSTAVIHPANAENIQYHAIELAAALTQSAFVGIITPDAQEPTHLQLISNQPQIEENEPRSWTLNLNDWPAFRQVLTAQQPLELKLAGRGARQLRAWYLEMGLPALGSLIIMPLIADNNTQGLLLFAGQGEDGRQDKEQQQLIAAATRYIALAIHNAEETKTAVSPLSPLQNDAVDSGRVIALEQERDNLEAYISTLEGRLQQTDQRLSDSSQRLQALTATITVMEKHGRTTRTAELEDEIAALREALLDAEEALAMAAASETELSTDWVMTTITRYSGQLEEAHMQIQALKNELLAWEKSAGNQAALLLVRELRAPITAVTGYTELLMKEQAGIITAKQRSFLTHIQSNTDRMAQLLKRLVQATAENRQLTDSPPATVEIELLIETAVDAILPQIREKQLCFDCTIAPDLPELPASYQMLTSALDGILEYSCQHAANIVSVTAAAHAIEEGSKHSYLRLSIGSDGLPIAAADLPHLFEERGIAPQLAMSRSLIEARGGRLWVESGNGQGILFSALLPLPHDG